MDLTEFLDLQERKAFIHFDWIDFLNVQWGRAFTLCVGQAGSEMKGEKQEKDQEAFAMGWLAGFCGDDHPPRKAPGSYNQDAYKRGWKLGNGQLHFLGVMRGLVNDIKKSLV